MISEVRGRLKKRSCSSRSSCDPRYDIYKDETVSGRRPNPLKELREENAILESALDALYLVSYKVRPVSMEKFLTDTFYLGNFTCKMKNIYPGWVPILKEIEGSIRRHLVVLKGPVGIGKSFIACGCYLPYLLYLISCLKDPYRYLSISEAGKLEVVFFTATTSITDSQCFRYMQSAITTSPWFLKWSGGGVIKTEDFRYMDLPLFKWTHVSPFVKDEVALSYNMVAAVIDATDSPNEHEERKALILNLFDSSTRNKSVSSPETIAISKMFIVASEEDRLSYFIKFIDTVGIRKKVYYYYKRGSEISPDRYHNGLVIEPTESDIIEPLKPIVAPQEPPPAPQQNIQQDVVSSGMFPRKPGRDPSAIISKLYKIKKDKNDHKL